MRRCAMLYAVIIASCLGGCAGVYADLAVGRTFAPTFTPTDPAAPEGTLDPATSVGLSVGAEVDFHRKGRLALGFQHHRQSIGAHDGTTTNAADARLDLDVLELSSRLKARVDVGAGLGSGGGDLTTTAGEILHSSGQFGALAYAGMGLAWYAGPRMGLHLLAGGQWLRQSVPLGTLHGVGLLARLTVALSFGDTRVDSQLQLATEEVPQDLAMLAAGARARGCDVVPVTHENLASLLVICADDPREAVYIQAPDGVLLTCEHRDRSECLAWHQSIVHAAGPKRDRTP